MKYIRYIFSWAFFGIGYLFSKLQFLNLEVTYKLYNFFMIKSHEIQGIEESGPWSFIDPDDE